MSKIFKNQLKPMKYDGQSLYNRKTDIYSSGQLNSQLTVENQIMFTTWGLCIAREDTNLAQLHKPIGPHSIYQSNEDSQ